MAVSDAELDGTVLAATVRQLQALVPILGTGSPEGAVAAPVGATYRRQDGGTGTSLYVKESGTGNTGWVGK